MRPAWGVKKIISWWVITVMSVDIFVEWRLGSSRENVIVLATMSWHIVVKCLNHCVVIMQRLVKLILSRSWHQSLKQETKNNSLTKYRVLRFQIHFLADDVDFALKRLISDISDILGLRCIVCMSKVVKIWKINI